jgi:hypothetical protein
MRIAFFTWIALLSTFAQADQNWIEFMQCSLRVTEGTSLPAIPKFVFKIARDEKATTYVLVETPLRPRGAPRMIKSLHSIGSESEGVFSTDDGTKVTFSKSDDQSMTAEIEASGLVYDCQVL